MASLSDTVPEALFRGTSYCNVQAKTMLSGIDADVRRYGWERQYDGNFSLDRYYINFALTGRSDNTVIRAPNDRQFMVPGDLVFLAPGAKFRTHCEPSDHLSLCISIDPRQIGLFDRMRVTLDRLKPCLDVRDREIHRMLTRLAGEICNPGFAHEMFVEAAICSLIVSLSRHFGAPGELAEKGASMTAWRLNWLKRRIAERLDTTISISGLAQECGVSTRHLIRTFKETEGVTFTTYISNARIALAKQLLLETDQPIKAIARGCGFANPSSFSVAFLTATGQNARQFRSDCKAHGGLHS